MFIKKHVAKFIIATVLTVAMTVGMGVVAAQIGLSLTPAVYACGTAGGGGC